MRPVLTVFTAVVAVLTALYMLAPVFTPSITLTDGEYVAGAVGLVFSAIALWVLWP